MRLFGELVEQYADFAAYARGDSPCFEEWALGVAADEELLALIMDLPPVKRQPNLVFAAARWHGAPAPAPYAVFRRAVLAQWDAVRATVLIRSTQTNEVGRLATLLPVFGKLQPPAGRPLALVEVGASAGLCLHPDRFGYRWQTERGPVTVQPSGLDAPTLACEVRGPAPLPDRPPVVGWRAGIDLEPLDVRDDDARAWLTTLVWPEQAERRERLVGALDAVRSDPPRLVRGDLLEELVPLLEEVPGDLTVVVFHSAVVAYLDPAARLRFQSMMSDLVRDGACHWVSNEGPDVLPDLTATGPPVPAGMATFVLALDGQALAWTHQHGASMTWLA